MDNSATHKKAEVRGWLVKNPRIHVHFTPNSGSWLNLVEVWFAIIDPQAIRRGTFGSVRDCDSGRLARLAGKIHTCLVRFMGNRQSRSRYVSRRPQPAPPGPDDERTDAENGLPRSGKATAQTAAPSTGAATRHAHQAGQPTRRL